MKRMLTIVAVGLVAFGVIAEELSLKSPNGRIEVRFLVEAGGIRWALSRDGQTIIEPSRLGLVFASGNGRSARERAELFAGLRVISKSVRAHDEIWTTSLYRKRTVRDRCNEMEVELAENANPFRSIRMVFRSYDSGVAFRYVVPEQEAFPGGFQLTGELTEWRFPGKVGGRFATFDSDFNSHEGEYLQRMISEIRPDEYVDMPAVVDVACGKVALCEASLLNWAGMNFRVPKDGQPDEASVLVADLVPLPKTEAATPNVAVIRTTPAESPWRVILCADDDVGLVNGCDLIPCLNSPPEPGMDFGWVKPGASSWDWWVESNNSISTELELKMVDFAAEMGWPYHTIDGGWYGFARRPNHGPNVALEPRPGFDLRRIVDRGREKGVGIWVWIHWMEIDDIGIEETFARLENWGIKGVKTDFINRQDQWIVCWYEKVLRIAAKHHILVNFHGAHKPTGIERTWPNNLTREAILGNEMNIFNKRITPEHCATLPFTRFLLGPADFTPGSFANVYSKDFVPQVAKGHRYGDPTDRCPHWAEEMGTRAHALALCVAYDSRLQTLCDWPERYRGATGVEVLKALPVAWKDTVALAGECGSHYIVRRESFDGRHYLAGFTVSSRSVRIPLDFLGEGRWTADVFCDHPEKTRQKATALLREIQTVRPEDVLKLEMATEGGFVVVLKKEKQ